MTPSEKRTRASARPPASRPAAAARGGGGGELAPAAADNHCFAHIGDKDEALLAAASLLAIEPFALTAVLTTRSLAVHGESTFRRFTAPLYPNEAAGMRDGLARALYARLFRWLAGRAAAPLRSTRVRAAEVHLARPERGVR